MPSSSRTNRFIGPISSLSPVKSSDLKRMPKSCPKSSNNSSSDCEPCGVVTKISSLLGFMITAKASPVSALVIAGRSEEHTSELQSRGHLVCRLLLEKKKKQEV